MEQTANGRRQGQRREAGRAPHSYLLLKSESAPLVPPGLCLPGRNKGFILAAWAGADLAGVCVQVRTEAHFQCGHQSRTPREGHEGGAGLAGDTGRDKDKDRVAAARDQEFEPPALTASILHPPAVPGPGIWAGKGLASSLLPLDKEENKKPSTLSMTDFTCWPD